MLPVSITSNGRWPNVATGLAAANSITANTPIGVVRGTAFVAAFVGMGTLGAAGMSRLLAKRIALLTIPNSQAMNWLRGAVMYELACLFPIGGIS
jgi:hypothetical protein